MRVNNIQTSPLHVDALTMAQATDDIDEDINEIIRYQWDWPFFNMVHK